MRKKSLPVVSMETGPAPDGEAAPSSVEIGASDLLLEGLIDRINLSRCVAQLPAGSRAIFVLHDIQGYNIARSRRCWDARKAPRSRNCTRLESGCANCCMKFSGKSIVKSARPPRRPSARLMAEFEIGGEEKCPIGTCAVHGKVFKPIPRGLRGHLSQCLGWRFPGIGN